MKKIIFQPAAVYINNGAIEILAGVELTAQEVRTLVETADIGGPWAPVVLVHSSGHRQRLSPPEIESVLAEPLAAHRAIIAQEQAEYAAAVQRAAKEAQAAQQAKEAAILEAQAQEAAAKKLQFQNAIG